MSDARWRVEYRHIDSAFWKLAGTFDTYEHAARYLTEAPVPRSDLRANSADRQWRITAPGHYPPDARPDRHTLPGEYLSAWLTQRERPTR